VEAIGKQKIGLFLVAALIKVTTVDYNPNEAKI
jgi:hypothetical protein